jgi:hypothetical protein
VLRLKGSDSKYRFVGHGYVDGYMYGKAAAQVKDGVKKLEWFKVH